MIEKIADSFRLRYHDLIRTIIMWVVADAMTREDAEKFIKANVTGGRGRSGLVY
jgi:hypothetical protein